MARLGVKGEGVDEGAAGVRVGSGASVGNGVTETTISITAVGVGVATFPDERQARISRKNGMQTSLISRIRRSPDRIDHHILQ
jgi:hypothetical protein